MKRLCPLLFISVFIFWSCEDEQEVDTTPPTVSITSPHGYEHVYEIVTISCTLSDNEGVEKVELWVNGVTTGLTDNTEPYSFEWNTMTLEDGNYTIIIRSYDTSENTTDSEPVVLTVDNTLSIPTPVQLDPYWAESRPFHWNDDLGGFEINWSQNNDDDFQYYKLYESLSEDMSNQTLLFETTDRTVTTYIKTTQNYMYYQIVVEDIWGFQSTSNIKVGDIRVTLWMGLYYDVSNTTEIDLRYGSYTGEIPSEIGLLINLTELDLRNNFLTGPIPPEIGNLTNLTFLGLDENEFTGNIPSEIGNLTNLTWLSLGYNQLTGEIPESICNLVENNCYFNFHDNQLCPPYPSCIVEEYVGEQDTSDCD
jgi:hypothetical protein